jgi:hypothetical protein
MGFVLVVKTLGRKHVYGGCRLSLSPGHGTGLDSKVCVSVTGTEGTNVLLTVYKEN